jgi:hypothetical protein
MNWSYTYSSPPTIAHVELSSNALRVQIDELNAEMEVARAEADRRWRRNGSGSTG